jgi:uncharacterized protein (TIGR00369 family)
MNIESLTAAGWTKIETGGFTEGMGPFWVRGAGAGCELGLVAEPRHSNNHMGTVHGGALMTLADVALGYAVVGVLGGRHCVTAQLQLQFVSGARIGDFVVCRPELLRQTSQLVFMRGLICVGETVAASADGIWKVLKAT